MSFIRDFASMNSNVMYQKEKRLLCARAEHARIDVFSQTTPFGHVISRVAVL